MFEYIYSKYNRVKSGNNFRILQVSSSIYPDITEFSYLYEKVEGLISVSYIKSLFLK